MIRLRTRNPKTLVPIEAVRPPRGRIENVFILDCGFPYPDTPPSSIAGIPLQDPIRSDLRVQRRAAIAEMVVW